MHTSIYIRIHLDELSVLTHMHLRHIDLMEIARGQEQARSAWLGSVHVPYIEHLPRAIVERIMWTGRVSRICMASLVRPRHTIGPLSPTGLPRLRSISVILVANDSNDGKESEATLSQWSFIGVFVSFSHQNP